MATARNRLGLAETYFRLLLIVRSAERRAVNTPLHQFEPTPVGLIGVMFAVVPGMPAVWSLVKALQLPLFRLVSM